MKRFFQIRPITILFLVTLLDLVGFGIVLPLLPALFTDPNSRYTLLTPGMSVQQGYVLFGLLIAIYPFFQFFTAPVWGQLSDRFGRRNLLAASMLAMSLSNGLFAFALYYKMLPLLFIAKALAGASGGNLSITQAVVADLYEPKERAKKFGIIGAGFGIGMVLGPYLGGKLIDTSIMPWFTIVTPFVFSTFLSVLSALSIILFLPETLHKKHDDEINWLQSLNNVASAYELKRMRAIFLVGFLFQASFVFFASFINVFLYKKFFFSESQIGEFFGYVGVWIAITQIGISRFILDRIPNRTTIVWSLSIYTIVILSLFVVSQTWMLLVGAALFSITNALAQMSILAEVSNQAHERSQGKILGLNASIYAVAQMIPPLLSGFLAATFQSNAPILAAAAVSGCAAIFYFINTRNQQESTS
jgi:DHA1 family tetracycline resistance protein-like MFS transporter